MTLEEKLRMQDCACAAIQKKDKSLIDNIEREICHILSNEPEWYQGFSLLGNIQEFKENYQDAERLYKISITTKLSTKKNVHSLGDLATVLNLINVLLPQDKRKEATDYLNLSVEMMKCFRTASTVTDSEEKSRALNLLTMKICEAYDKLEKYVEPYKILKTIAEENPTHPFINYTIGFYLTKIQIMKEKEHFQEANEYYIKALQSPLVKIDENFELMIRLALGRNYASIQQFHLADEQLQKSIKLSDNPQGTNNLKGFIQVHQKKFKECIKSFEEELKIEHPEKEITFPAYEKMPELTYPILGNYSHFESTALYYIGLANLLLVEEEKRSKNLISSISNTPFPDDRKLLGLEYLLKALDKDPTNFKAEQLIRKTVFELKKDYNELVTFYKIKEIFEKNKSFGKFDYLLIDLFVPKQNQQQSNEIVSEALNIILKDKKLTELKSLSETSQNPVSIFLKGPLTSELFVLKTYKENSENANASLKKEFLTNLFVWRIFQKHYVETLATEKNISSANLKTIEPIIIHRLDNKNYIITKRVGALTMEDLSTCWNETEFLTQIDSAIETLGKLHGLITPWIKNEENKFYLEIEYQTEKNFVEVPKYDYKKEFVSRLIEGKPYDKNSRLESLVENKQSDLVQEFVFQYNSLLKDITPTPLFFTHTDAHIGNFLENGIILDFEKASMGNPMLDLSLITQQCNQDYVIRHLLKHYIKKIKLYSAPEMQIPTELEFLHQFQICRLHNTFCSLGGALSLNRKDRVFAHLNYLNLILHDFKELRDSFAKMLNQNNKRINLYFNNF